MEAKNYAYAFSGRPSLTLQMASWSIALWDNSHQPAKLHTLKCDINASNPEVDIIGLFFFEDKCSDYINKKNNGRGIQEYTEGGQI